MKKCDTCLHNDYHDSLPDCKDCFALEDASAWEPNQIGKARLAAAKLLKGVRSEYKRLRESGDHYGRLHTRDDAMTSHGCYCKADSCAWFIMELRKFCRENL